MWNTFAFNRLNLGIVFWWTHQNKISKSKKMIFFFFYYLFPGGRLMPAPKLSAWFSGCCWSSPQTKTGWTLQPWQDSAEGESQLYWKHKWKEEKSKTRKKTRGRRGAGCQERWPQDKTTTETPLSPGLYPTTPLISGQARPNPPLLTPLGALSTPLHRSAISSLEQISTHYLLKWGKKGTCDVQ